MAPYWTYSLDEDISIIQPRHIASNIAICFQFVQICFSHPSLTLILPYIQSTLILYLMFSSSTIFLESEKKMYINIFIHIQYLSLLNLPVSRVVKPHSIRRSS